MEIFASENNIFSTPPPPRVWGLRSDLWSNTHPMPVAAFQNMDYDLAPLSR